MPQSIARPVFQVSVAAIMLFQVAALFARSRLELSFLADGMQESVAKDLSYLVVPPVLLALMFPYVKRCRKQLLTLFRPSALTWRVVWLSLLLGLTLRILRWAVLTLLIRAGVLVNTDPAAPIGPLMDFACPAPALLLLSLGVSALTIPIIEETINRGFILHALLQKGAVLSIGMSALLFALMHPPSSYLHAFIIGTLLAVQALNYGTLWGPVIAHAAYNAAAVFDWECFRIIWNPPASDPQLVKLSAIAAPVVVLGFCLTLFIVTRRSTGARDAPRRA
jgi:membrane protease YdiL (CAAX protease family)